MWLAAHGLSLVGIVTVLEHMPMSTAAYGAVPRIAIGPKLPGRMYTSVVIRKKKNRETYDSEYQRLQHAVAKEEGEKSNSPRCIIPRR